MSGLEDGISEALRQRNGVDFGIDEVPAVAELVATYMREHFTEHAEELGLTKELGNHWFEMDEPCPCGSGHPRGGYEIATRYATGWVRDE